MTEPIKLTSAQYETLIDIERGGAIGTYCAPHYKPGTQLVEMGLACRRDHDRLAITAKGLAYLQQESQP